MAAGAALGDGAAAGNVFVAVLMQRQRAVLGDHRIVIIGGREVFLIVRHVPAGEHAGGCHAHSVGAAKAVPRGNFGVTVAQIDVRLAPVEDGAAAEGDGAAGGVDGVSSVDGAAVQVHAGRSQIPIDIDALGVISGLHRAAVQIKGAAVQIKGAALKAVRDVVRADDHGGNAGVDGAAVEITHAAAVEEDRVVFAVLRNQAAFIFRAVTDVQHTVLADAEDAKIGRAGKGVSVQAEVDCAGDLDLACVTVGVYVPRQVVVALGQRRAGGGRPRRPCDVFMRGTIIARRAADGVLVGRDSERQLIIDRVN